MNVEMKSWIDGVEGKLGEIDVSAKEAIARLNEIEQKMVRAPGGGTPMEEKSWGAQFIELAGNDLKSFADYRVRPSRLGMELKTTITTGATSGGPAGLQTYRDEPVNMPRRQLRVRDLLPTVPISTGSFEYAKQTTRTLNAAPVAEGALKPESALGWTMQTGTPKVIAHWVPASRQILEDAPQLSGLIDTELRYGLAVREDAQLLAGDGTGENLPGLITNATAYAAPFTMTGMTMIDQVGLAILQATLSDFTPTGIVMHPSDWMRIKLLKDAAGGYLTLDPTTGNNGNSGTPTLHGLPVALTTSIAIDKFLVGDFPAAATLYDRWTPRVEVSTEHADFFTRNLVAILAEERIGLAIKQSGALIYGDFGNVP